MDPNCGFIIWSVFFTTINAMHPECSIIWHLQKKEAECRVEISSTRMLVELNATDSRCPAEWDGVNCWPVVSVGESISVSCPPPLIQSHEFINRTCTSDGWSKLSVPYFTACFQDEGEEQDETQYNPHYFANVKLIYTVGYAVSITSLSFAIVIFCLFRKLLCTRTYIHLNLFMTFILKALAVFIKDGVLFTDQSVNHCTVSTVLCKASVTFLQFCVLTNFCWLLVEGLNLQMLLIFSFTYKKTFFRWYCIIGWGSPFIIITIWMYFKNKYDNQGCWDDLDSRFWWIIKIPILLSIFLNFLMFVNISRIIVAKTQCPDSVGGDRRLYRRLAKSTLLLIPLFGVHYTVFALFPEHVGLKSRLLLELVLGSFQGFIVALLYCFLNIEVQSEIRKKIETFKSRTDTNSLHMTSQVFTA